MKRVERFLPTTSITGSSKVLREDALWAGARSSSSDKHDRIMVETIKTVELQVAAVEAARTAGVDQTESAFSSVYGPMLCATGDGEVFNHRLLLR